MKAISKILSQSYFNRATLVVARSLMGKYLVRKNGKGTIAGRIVEVVGLMRQKVKNGRLLIQHNIEYGFFRNLIGGAILGLIMSCIDSVYFYHQDDDTLMGISLFLVFSFSILLILNKIIIQNLGKLYAKRLFQEYLQK